MSSLDPSGNTRPLRVAGIALLAAAGIAAVAGVVSLAGGSSTPSAEPPPAASATTSAPVPVFPSSTSAPPAAGSSSSAPSSPTGIPAPPGQPGQPGPGQPVAGPIGGGGQPDGGQQAARPDVRVYNNSTIKGLAARAADEIRGLGWAVPEVGNYPDGVLPTTTVFFRPGTPEEAAAHELAQEIGAQAQPRFPGIQNASAGLIVIVTNDYKGPQGK